jgi:hypothetical protein
MMSLHPIGNCQIRDVFKPLQLFQNHSLSNIKRCVVSWPNWYVIWMRFQNLFGFANAHGINIHAIATAAANTYMCIYTYITFRTRSATVIFTISLHFVTLLETGLFQSSRSSEILINRCWTVAKDLLELQAKGLMCNLRVQMLDGSWNA